MIHETFNSGVVRERRDDTARTVTTYGPTGQVTETRPYTAPENADADERAAVETRAAVAVALTADAGAEHIPCLTVGIHGCERDKTLDGDLITQGVDLVVQGHDHNYSRSHQITQLAKVVDSDNNYAKGRGTVFAVVGNGGYKPREITGCPAMWAACSGTNSPGGSTTGWMRIDATGSTLTARLVTTSGPLTDTFTITR